MTGERFSMNDSILLTVDGEVATPREFSFTDLAAIDAASQIADVGSLAPGRQGSAVRLGGLLELVRPSASAAYLGLHSSTDNFHASIPLAPLLERAILIYCKNGAPLSTKDGGPIRFYIPDFAACHTDEIDECANVKFVDHLELTAAKGFDNRPEDDAQHEKLHQQE